MLVVGAGPAGSAAATLLARAGHRVRLVDRAAFPRDKACSEYMSPEAVRILDRLGVVESLEAAGAAPLQGTVVTAARGARLDGRFALAGGRPYRPTGLSVSRRVLDHRLTQAARAAGAELVERTTVEELLYDGGAVAGAVLRGPGGRTAVRARLTVGADGLRSVVARRLGARRPAAADPGRLRGPPRRRRGDGTVGRAVRGIRGLRGPQPDRRRHDQRCPGGAPARAGEARGRAEGFFLETVRSFGPVARRIEHASVVRPVLATGPFSAWSGRVTADGAALVGDAADFFDPFTGEGSTARSAAPSCWPTPRGPRWSGRAPPRWRPIAAPAAGLRRQVGGRAPDRLRDALSSAVRPGRGPARAAGPGPYPDRRHRRLRPARAVLNPSFLARMLV